MIDLGITKIALIGVVALLVIGPEKLPRVARTVGTLLGKAQRYVADVKAEVNRSMELDSLKNMRSTVEDAARSVESAIHDQKSAVEASLQEGLDGDTASQAVAYPAYRRPRKNWRLKQGAVPNWYKARHGVRSKALSGAARVARYRPTRTS